MTSHELAAVIGIIAICTTLGAFFLGYFFAKRKSKKIVESESNNIEKEDSESTKPEDKKFDWI